MVEVADRRTAAVEARQTSLSLASEVRPEILEFFRARICRDDSDQKRKNYRNIFDRLINQFGQSPEMVVVSWSISDNIIKLIGERDPKGWRWGPIMYSDPELEKRVREFEQYESLFRDRVCKLLPMAQELRDSWPVFDEGLDNLVKALEPFARPRNRAPDPRSQWHDTAVLFTSRIEEHFRKTGLHPPTRKSARSSLVLAVQSLLSMVGFQVEAETIRKVLSV